MSERDLLRKKISLVIDTTDYIYDQILKEIRNRYIRSNEKYRQYLRRIYECINEISRNIIGLKIIIERISINNNLENNINPLDLLREIGFIAERIVDDKKCSYVYTFIIWIPDVINYYLQKMDLSIFFSEISELKNKLDNIQKSLKYEGLEIEHAAVRDKLEQLGLNLIVIEIIKHVYNYVNNVEEQLSQIKTQLDYIKHIIEPHYFIDMFLSYSSNVSNKEDKNSSRIIVLNKLLSSILGKYIEVYTKYSRIADYIKNLHNIIFLLEILVKTYFDPKGFIRFKQEIEGVFHTLSTINSSINSDEYIKTSISTLLFNELKKSISNISLKNNHELQSLIDNLSHKLFSIIQEGLEYQNMEILY